MRVQVLLRLRGETFEVDKSLAWFAFDSRGQLLDKGEHALVELKSVLAERFDYWQLSLLVGAQCVLVNEVSVPSQNPRQVRQALSFVAEELLLEDIEHVHLALAPQRRGELLDLGIVAHSKLIHWLDALHSAGLPPEHFYIDALCLPVEPEAISVAWDGERYLLRSGEYAGLACERDDLADMLAALLSKASMADIYYLIDDEAEQTNFDSLCEQLNIEGARRKPVNYAESLEEIMAATAMRQGSDNLNLLQGGYDQQLEQQGDWRRFKPLGFGLAASLLLVLVFQFGTAWWLEREAKEYRASSEQLYRELFPGQRVVSPRRQMRSQLASDGSGALDLLAEAAPVLNQQQLGFQVDKLRFEPQRGEWQLEVKSKDLAQLEQLKAELAGQGIQATIQSASEQSGYLLGRLVLGR